MVNLISLLTSRSSLINAVSGSVGAMASITAVYPLIVLRTKAAVAAESREVKEKDAAPTNDQAEPRIVRWLKALLSLYHGLPVALAEGGLQKFIYFYSFAILSKLQAVLTRKRKMGTIVNLVVGYLAAMSTILFTLPLESISTKLQIDNQCTFIDAVVRTFADLPALLTGITPAIVLCINPAIQFTVYERLKALLMRKLVRGELARRTAGVVAASFATEGRSKIVELSTQQSFWLGATSKAVATLITFPLLTAKLVLLRGRSPVTDSKTDGSVKNGDHEVSLAPAPAAPLEGTSPSTVTPSTEVSQGESFLDDQDAHAQSRPSMAKVLSDRFREKGVAGFYAGALKQQRI